MATVRDIITQALKRIRVIASGETPQASDIADGLTALNQMMSGWATNGVNVLHNDYALADTFTFFVPPTVLDGVGSTTTTMDYLTDQGDWDASLNSPILSNGGRNRGDVFRVSVSGATIVDNVVGATVGQFIIFNGVQWIPCEDSTRRQQGVIAMLAVRLAEDYGVAVTPVVARDAADGWSSLLQQFVHVPDATFDPALTRTPSRRWPYSFVSTDGIVPST